jgi:hypothetical protein
MTTVELRWRKSGALICRVAVPQSWCCVIRTRDGAATVDLPGLGPVEFLKATGDDVELTVYGDH